MTELDRIVKYLQLMQAEIPDGLGCVSATIQHDGSFSIDLEYSGVDVAYVEDCKMVINYATVINANPDWLPEIESIVERINKLTV